MTNTWAPSFILPNLELSEEEAVEGDFLALVGPNDPRVRTLANAHPNYGKFIRSFTEAFGVKLKPAILLHRADTPSHTLTVEAVAGFRDAVVAATVPKTRAAWIVNGAGWYGGVHYSDAFAFHPWFFAADNTHIISNTPAQLALHEVAKFRGQSDPHLGVTTLHGTDIDGPLWLALMSRWNSRFGIPRPSRDQVALFRSLNMANQAMAVAGGPEAQGYDFGRLAGLWASAFEVLFHPGTSTGIREKDVRDRLGNFPWRRRDLRVRRYYLQAGAEPIKQKGVPVRVSLPELIYFQLNSARNAFLHGNDVSLKSLRFQPDGQPLAYLAATLYRMALAEHLGLVWTEGAPADREPQQFAEWMGRQSNFLQPQLLAEDALAVARVSPKKVVAQRRVLLEQRKRARRPLAKT